MQLVRTLGHWVLGTSSAQSCKCKKEQKAEQKFGGDPQLSASTKRWVEQKWEQNVPKIWWGPSRTLSASKKVSGTKMQKC